LKLYEGMFLFDSNLAGKDWPGLERHVQDVLEKNSAEMVYSERWPDRKLCYEIKGAKKGTYLLTYFRAPPQAIQGISREVELSERILRILVLYDAGLVTDCEKRVSKEVTGSPEEIEEQRERLRRDAQDALPGRDLTGRVPLGLEEGPGLEPDPE
jgi:ribosomal protein S6